MKAGEKQTPGHPSRCSAGICLNLTLFSLGALGNFHSLTFTLLDYPASAAVLQAFSRIAWQEGVISFGANSTGIVVASLCRLLLAPVRSPTFARTFCITG